MVPVTKVIKLKKKDYEKWLRQNEGRIRVVDVQRTGGWTNWYGPNMDFVVTYEVAEADSGPKR